MLINPITLYHDGAFQPYPQNTPFLNAIAYAPNPDNDGVTRPEPSPDVLQLGYGPASNITHAAIYARMRLISAVLTTIPVTLELRDGSTILRTFTLNADTHYTTHSLLHEFHTPYTTQSDLRVHLWTTGFTPTTEQPSQDYLDVSMLILGLTNQDIPLYRRVEIHYAHGYLAPHWYILIETNDSAPVEMPKGFKFIASDDLRYDPNTHQLLLPHFERTTRNYLFTALLREGDI